ncbi:BnaAnng39170D, partial [Brassica napus]
CVQAYMRATTLPAQICFDVQCLLLLMDLETENQIASVLLRKAAELRRQAEKDGVRAYLEKPNVRHRPNSRFLTATVLGVQQSVETNEMWKAQEQENERLKRKSREESSSSSSQMKRSSSFSKRSLDKKCSSINEERKITHQSPLDKRLYLDDDDEFFSPITVYICLFAIASVTFSFLHLLSLFVNDRNKRGRGSVGPRMDETVPYLPTEKVDQLQKVRGDIEFAVYECLQEEWGVLEKSLEAALDVDQTIFVVVAEDVERSKTTVLWAARNFSGKKICSLYVHRPARPASCSENLLLLFLSDLTVLW